MSSQDGEELWNNVPRSSSIKFVRLYSTSAITVATDNPSSLESGVTYRSENTTSDVEYAWITYIITLRPYTTYNSLMI
ncbi:MAG TPA: hypothetical protein VI935_04020 [Thermodesulfobacteriota bacterium]|nr:hypothetical protein [Thermodesulfobacteriota bacterium]